MRIYWILVVKERVGDSIKIFGLRNWKEGNVSDWDVEDFIREEMFSRYLERNVELVIEKKSFELRRDLYIIFMFGCY